MNMIDDALALCLEIQNTKESWKAFGANRYIAMERPLKYDLDIFTYSNPLTPQFLQKESILTIIHSNFRDIFVKQKPKGFHYVEFDFEKMNEWTKKISGEELEKVEEVKKGPLSELSPYQWKPDLKRHKGKLVIQGQSITFHGGTFEGVNLLLKHINTDVSNDDLQREISEPLQRIERNKISLAKWRYDLMNKRKIFAKYFNLKFIKPASNRLTQVA